MLRSKSCKINSHLSNLVCRGAGWVVVLHDTKFYQRLPSDSFILSTSTSSFQKPPSQHLILHCIYPHFPWFPSFSSFPVFLFQPQFQYLPSLSSAYMAIPLKTSFHTYCNCFVLASSLMLRFLGIVCLYVMMLFNKRH